MRTRSGKNSGFTLTEVIVVMVIVAIAAVVATPMYISQSRRARTVEAVAALNAIRQAERNYYAQVNHNSTFLAVTANNIQNDPSATSNPGLALNYTRNTYFDNHCFTVATDATYLFVIACDGNASGNAAPNAADVTTYRLQMRGSDGTMRCSYDGGTSWTTWQ